MTSFKPLKFVNPIYGCSEHFPNYDFQGYMTQNYPSLPSIDNILKFGIYEGCCGAPFQQEESDPFEAEFFGSKRQFFVLKFETQNFKNETRCCAKSLFLVNEDSSPTLMFNFITTCDPFCMDHFNAPVGIEKLSKEEKRASFNPETNKIELKNDIAPIEYEVFYQSKFVFHRGNMEKLSTLEDMEKFRQHVMSSSFVSMEVIRILLGDYCKHVPTAEQARDAIGKSVTPEEFALLKKDERVSLNDIVRTITPHSLYSKYMKMLDQIKQDPINLVPSNYKARGRKLIMMPGEIEAWDSLVFLRILGAHAERAKTSPLEFFLGFSCKGCAEVSDSDERFAVKTPAGKLGDMTNTWLVETAEKVLDQQGVFFADLKGFIASGDLDAAFEKLTTGTAVPKNGQGLLGLAVMTLHKLTTRELQFPQALVQRITDFMAGYGIVWTLPLLDIRVNPEADSAVDYIYMIGAPIRSSRSGSA